MNTFIKKKLRRLRLALDYSRGTRYHELRRMRTTLQQELRSTSMSTVFVPTHYQDGTIFHTPTYCVTYMGQSIAVYYKIDECYKALNDLRRQINELGIIRIKSQLKIA